MFHNDGKKSATLDSRKFSFRKLKKDTIDPSEKSTSSEKSGQSSKLTVKKIFRKSSFKKLISHITRITSSQLNNVSDSIH